MKMLDTHALYKHFLEAGFDEKKSEVLSDAILQNSNTEKVEEIKSEFVKKSDLEIVVNRLEIKIDKLESKLETKIEVSIAKLETKIADSKSEIIRWMVGLILISHILPIITKALGV